jgi:hypothetical protein
MRLALSSAEYLEVAVFNLFSDLNLYVFTICFRTTPLHFI